MVGFGIFNIISVTSGFPISETVVARAPQAKSLATSTTPSPEEVNWGIDIIYIMVPTGSP